MKPNLDPATIKSFGDEWSRFDQTEIEGAEAEAIFGEYFSVFPWAALPNNASGFDMGCGSGRWARLVAPRVGRLHCIDPSSALEVAQRSLADCDNVSFHRVGAEACLENTGLMKKIPACMRGHLRRHFGMVRVAQLHRLQWHAPRQQTLANIVMLATIEEQPPGSRAVTAAAP